MTGLASKTLQKMHAAGGMSTDMRAHQWFSLHTQTRSYDFGAKVTYRLLTYFMNDWLHSSMLVNIMTS